MERLTKRIVVVSTIGALSLLVYLVGRGSSQIFSTAVAAFVLSCALSIVAGDLALSVILPITCFIPALFLVLTGVSNLWDFSPWIAALLGFLMPQNLRAGWSFPSRWKAPLILWSVSLALSWPIIAAREVDFALPLLNRYDLWSSRAGVPPPFVLTWTASVVCLNMIGLLWLDWLFGAYPRDLKRFETRIVWPILAASVIGAAVGVYQSFGHAGFLNPTVYGVWGRATGTMLDGNAFGTMTATWLPTTLAVLFQLRSRRKWAAGVWLAVILAFAISIWASGSRTALLTAVVGTTVLVASSWHSVNPTKVLLTFGLLIVLVAGVVVLTPASTPGPWRRIHEELIPDLSLRTLGRGLFQFWDRNRYGTAAARMIAEHPLVGVGVGGFHVQVRDAAYVNGYDGLPPDNAQNWFRHQLAEMGILGSIGLLIFSGTFIWLLFRPCGRGNGRPFAGAAKGGIVGIGVASLLGMPTQNPAVLVSFLALTFWWLRLTEPADGETTTRSPLGAREWTFIGGILGCFLAGTAYVGWTELRPPYRAIRADWKYQYGFHDDVENSEVRWTEGKAVDVFPIEQPNEYRWLKLVIGAVAPDADQRPVVVNVWRDHELILRLTRRSDVQKTWYVGVPKGRKMMMVQIEVSRSWRAVDYGRRGDPWERGVAVGKWTFAYDPPKGELLIH